MTAVELAGLLKDYGPWGLLALALLAVSYLQRRSDAVTEKYQRNLEALVEKLAVTVERNNGTNAAVTAALESRTGIFERLHEAVEQAKAETRSLITDLKQHGVTNDQWTREKLVAAVGRIETILQRIEDLRREVGK
ncbi:hypothetical protein [Methylobacterium nodulans]|uniref:Ribonucleoside-diphosphate reductase, alpha subunit n=1 Tax=Methylobacterium nodulans (strain LMG 21967 / CNCM I-2342 / ORS 2060) TaxID=460265 RepID=B8IDT3_METNO|nr:hypothetical protein [Methylobacterium nodulans]ACL55655.1 ribonucleoside-diphosphate reductase, alpha subunit [Methylobacterium nodulans ORS 2060]